MDPAAIRACQFAAWYPSFREVAFRSVIIPLPPAFVEYLVQDGVFLPEGSDALPRRAQLAAHEDYEAWEQEACEAVDPQQEAAQMPEFPQLMADIEDAIASLGGRVAPKLSWSSPHDAAWVSARSSLACCSASEVLLLLKSSDRVAHDICHAFDACAPGRDPQRLQQQVQHSLALRKWVPLQPEREFRCFVRRRELIAVCQRNLLEYAPNLAAQEDELLEALLEFFEQHVQESFPCADFTFDVYITTAGRVRLIDFNPVGGTTSPLLFDWEELRYEGLPPAQHEDACAGEPDGAVSAQQQTAAGAAEAEGAAQSRGAPEPAGHAAAAEGDAEVLSREGVNGSRVPGVDGEQHGSNGHGAGEAGTGEILFRLAPPDGQLRPGAAAYGAPYDMADLSDGGAIAELLRKLQVEQQED